MLNTKAILRNQHSIILFFNAAEPRPTRENVPHFIHRLEQTTHVIKSTELFVS